MARVPARSSFGSLFNRGGSVPSAVIVLIVATAVTSIVGIVGHRHGLPLLTLGVLDHAGVMRGQLWRLFTWVFFEQQPFTLLMAAAGLYWFGRDLARRWGSTRFIVSYLCLAAVVGAITIGLGALYAPIAAVPQLGSWAVIDALVILWASYYPTQQIMMMFVLPMSGRTIVYFTIGMTVLLSLFEGLEPFVPNFVAELVALGIVMLPSPREMMIERKLRTMERGRKATHLKSVPRDRDDEAPPTNRWLN